MRIHRLEFGIVKNYGIDERRDNIDWHAWGVSEGHCFCKLLDLGPFYVTWLSYECLAGIYSEKARLYRVKRYLKARKQRPT